MRIIGPIFLLSALFAMTVAADDKLLISGISSDSSVAAPILRWSAGSYTIGLSGWTVDAGWRKSLDGVKTVLITADATPIHAHNSNRIYSDGERVRDLEYDDAAYRLRTGLQFKRGERSRLEGALVLMQERVHDVADPRIAAFWRNPYAGVEAGHVFSIMNKRNPLIAAFDGIETSVRGETFFGAKQWSRIRISESAAHTAGRIHLRQSLTAMNGSALNIVNAFLVGGSWDALGGDAVYGSRYGEYRVRRAVIASGGGDVLLPRNWRLGIRGSVLRSDAANTVGHALNASTTWRTFGLNFGVGLPKDHSAIVYASVVAPLYRK